MFNAKNILYEDNHLIIVDKPSCQLTQSDTTGDLSLENDLKAFIKIRDNKPGAVYLGVVHRIDRPVSGVVVFTKTSKALTRLNNLVKERKIVKRYLAITESAPSEKCGVLKHHIERNPKKNRSYAYNEPTTSSKEAVLEYETVGVSDNYFLISVNLITGRHHQIRCQLSEIGCSIKGDLKYGAKRSNKNGGISLHASSVSFEHPITKEMLTVTAPTPCDDKLWEYFKVASKK